MFIPLRHTNSFLTSQSNYRDRYIIIRFIQQLIMKTNQESTKINIKESSDTPKKPRLSNKSKALNTKTKAVKFQVKDEVFLIEEHGKSQSTNKAKQNKKYKEPRSFTRSKTYDTPRHIQEEILRIQEKISKIERELDSILAKIMDIIETLLNSLLSGFLNDPSTTYEKKSDKLKELKQKIYSTYTMHNLQHTECFQYSCAPVTTRNQHSPYQCQQQYR